MGGGLQVGLLSRKLSAGVDSGVTKTDSQNAASIPGWYIKA